MIMPYTGCENLSFKATHSLEKLPLLNASQYFAVSLSKLTLESFIPRYTHGISMSSIQCQYQVVKKSSKQMSKYGCDICFEVYILLNNINGQ